jgi:hypothetical protein
MPRIVFFAREILKIKEKLETLGANKFGPNNKTNLTSRKTAQFENNQEKN